MKYLISLSLYLLSLSFACSHDPRQEISKMLDAYFAEVQQKQVDELLEYLHPKLLGMVGKSLFEQQYDQMFNGQDASVSFLAFSQDSISSVFEHDTGNYALVQYSFQMRMTLKETENSQAGEKLLNTYRGQFGEENVIEEESGAYLISAKRELLACQEPGFEGWKLLDYEPGMKIILSQFIAADVFKHFNK